MSSFRYVQFPVNALNNPATDELAKRWGRNNADAWIARLYTVAGQRASGDLSAWTKKSWVHVLQLGSKHARQADRIVADMTELGILDAPRVVPKDVPKDVPKVQLAGFDLTHQSILEKRASNAERARNFRIRSKDLVNDSFDTVTRTPYTLLSAFEPASSEAFDVEPDSENAFDAFEPNAFSDAFEVERESKALSASSESPKPLSKTPEKAQEKALKALFESSEKAHEKASKALDESPKPPEKAPDSNRNAEYEATLATDCALTATGLGSTLGWTPAASAETKRLLVEEKVPFTTLRRRMLTGLAKNVGPEWALKRQDMSGDDEQHKVACDALGKARKAAQPKEALPEHTPEYIANYELQMGKIRALLEGKMGM